MIPKDPNLTGRYINYQMIFPVLSQYTFKKITDLGYSVQNRPIKLYQIGKGAKKILIWSQMHGNESTTTKALFDVLRNISDRKSNILNQVSISFIPMLNPDGAEVYTRVNASNIDLNRDAFELSQPESKCLRKAYELVKPDFCFNLHDQRTIFSVGKTSKPATISFLAPSFDELRNVNRVRQKAMEVICAINQMLQKFIPNQVGRFDDAFNINCTGDMFSSLNTPTILFESGHYPNDYQREETRKYVALSIMEALSYIGENDVTGNRYAQYFDIPENDKLFFDILIRDDFSQNTNDIGILFKEILTNNRIIFEPYIEKIGNLQNYYGHSEHKLSEFFTEKIDKNHIEKHLDLNKFRLKNP